MYRARKWHWTFNGPGRLGRWYPRHNTIVGHHLFSVREYGRRKTTFGRIWAIERELYPAKTNQEVLALSSIPLLFTDPVTPKDITQACHPKPREGASSLGWLTVAMDVAVSRRVRGKLGDHVENGIGVVTQLARITVAQLREVSI
jgi:hypothetical protein